MTNLTLPDQNEHVEKLAWQASKTYALTETQK